MAADLILTGGAVRTANRAQPTAEALAIRGGRVLAVGSEDDVLAHRDDRTTVRDLAGAAVYPGFVDVHNHHAVAGVTDLFELSFGVALGVDEILERVRARAETLPPGAWITGGSWASTLMSELNSSAVRERLDEASGGRPVMLSDDSHHNRWVNTSALRLAGITKDAIPADGVTLLDPDDGEPSGVLLEAAGMLVAQARTASGGLTAEQHRQASRRGVELLSTFGVTAFQDAAVSLETLGALRALDQDGELDAWVVSSLLVNDEIFGYETIGEALIARGEEFRTEHHRPDFVKIFLDGVPPARTALFLEPYLPDEAHGAHFHGTTTMDADELHRWLSTVAQRGLGAKVHVTGDGTARLLLDVVERLRGRGLHRRAGPDGARAVPGRRRHRADGAARRLGRHLAVPLVPRGHPRRPRRGARRGPRGALAAQSVDHRRRRPRRGRLGLAGQRVARSVRGDAGTRDARRPARSRTRRPVARAGDHRHRSPRGVHDQRRHRDGSRCGDGVARSPASRRTS